MDRAAIGRVSGRLGPGLALAGLVLVLDQASKWLVLLWVMDPPRAIAVLPFFNLVHVWNRGVSFGLFGAQALSAWIFVAVAVAIVVALLIWLVRVRDRFSALAIGLIVGGAAGNVVDRLVHGAVYDFLDFHLGGYHWPAFNLADSAITVGALLLVVESLFIQRARHK